MNFKNILFVISFAFALPCHGFYGLDFLRKQNSQKKSGLTKMGIGIAFALPAYVESNSMPINIVKSAGALTGGGLMIAGFWQFLVDALAEEEVQESLYLRTPRFDNFVHAIATNEQFIAGALLAATGLVLKCASETDNASDTSFASAAIGLALMGAVAGKQFGKDYLPLILAYLNK